MFWLLCSVMMAGVGYALIAPLMRPVTVARPTAAYDLDVYRQQLRDVERDVSRGVIPPDEADRVRVEISRRVLEADRALATTQKTADRAPGAGAVIALTVAILLGCLGAYIFYLGHPAMPDQPLSARLASAKANYDARPTQQAAEAAFPETPVDADPSYAALVQQLRERVAAQPNDQQALRLLVRNEQALGHIRAAKDAQTRLIALNASGTSADDLAELAALTVASAGGIVTAEAERHIDDALKLDAQNGLARYLRGVLLAQTGRPDLTFPIWADLLTRDDAASAPWASSVRQAMPAIAWLAGQPDYTLPEPPAAAALPGPDADAVAAAADQTPEERAEMVQGMVASLESRLATDGGSAEEWARLITAHVVIGNTDHARNILAEARQIFASSPDGLTTINSAATQAGLE
ncbi:MAG: c-type cytochrome biogenesis protein CcmI [Paracoccus denitrificans]|nr:MAG: c-type cytochrome biogenesis protein CcmI [Paracoccus denitrificans]PZO85297.1 MAG: c-type cytochrome biogenesis protein CcmI [Paracoccus denitrificans]